MNRRLSLFLILCAPYLSKAQLSKRIDSTVTALISTLPEKHRKPVQELYTMSISKGFLKRTDSAQCESLFSAHSLCLSDTSSCTCEYYLTADHRLSRAKTSELDCYDDYLKKVPFNADEKSLVKYYRSLKPVQAIPYEKTLTTGTGCMCYSGFRLRRIKKRHKQAVRFRLEHTYRILIHADKSFVRVSIQLPPKNPRFKRVVVLCGKWF